MKYRNCSLIIQGPLRSSTVDNWLIHKDKFEKVLISTWKPKKQDDSRLEIIFNDQPTRNQNYDLRIFGNLDKQLFSLLKGLEQITTEFCLKGRTDEYYQSLDPLLKMHFDNDLLLSSIDCITRTWNYSPAHISDHLFIFKTKEMIKAINFFFEFHKKETSSALISYLGRERMAVESVFSLLYLKEFGFTLRDKEKIKEFVDIIDTNKMGDFIFKRNNLRQTLINKKSDFVSQKDFWK